MINGVECVPRKEEGVHIRRKAAIIITYYENKRFNDNINLYVYVLSFSNSSSFVMEEIDFFDVLGFYIFDDHNSSKLYGSSYKLTERLVEKEINWEGEVTFSSLELPFEATPYIDNEYENDDNSL